MSGDGDLTAAVERAREDRFKRLIAVAGLAVALAGPTATYIYQQAANERAAQQLCIEQYGKVLDVARRVRAESTAPSLAAEDAQQLNVMRKFVSGICKRAGLDTPTQAFNVATAAPMPPPPPTPVPKPAPTAPQIDPKAAAHPGLTGATVFVQYTAAGQKADALQLQARLKALGYRAPGVEFVDTPVRSSTVRYLLAADAAAAGELAQVLNSQLTSPKLDVQDLSARYGRSTAVRGGTFEIWFDGTAQIRLAPPQPS